MIDNTENSEISVNEYAFCNCSRKVCAIKNKECTMSEIIYERQLKIDEH